MENQIILHGIKTDALVNLINENVKALLIEHKNELLNKEANEDLLTRSEACSLLQINSSTLWAWTCNGKITGYGIANRRYYKRSEILESLIELKTKGGKNV